MRIFLVRHGQSDSNVNHNVSRSIADHAIGLTDVGKQQACIAGKRLAEYYDNIPGIDMRYLPFIRMWNSPYTRTRQTALLLDENCIRKNGSNWITDKREHLLLAEQQFGIFDGLSDVDREKQYPEFQAYYKKCKAFEGKLWPKMPLGESRFEVAQRVHQSFGTFHRDASRHGINDIVIVGHGTTNRAFVMMWLHLPYEWMHEEPNPKNCSIRLIEDSQDKGYIFGGFEV